MNLKKLLALGLSLTMATALLAGCGSTNDTSADAGSAGESGDTSAEQVVIYSNADEEAITAMENALDSNGYEGQYVFQTFGTSELGGNQTENGVFVCFAPYDDPEIAVAIVIEHATWGSNLATTGVDILNAYFTADETGSAVTGENQLLP